MAAGDVLGYVLTETTHYAGDIPDETRIAIIVDGEYPYRTLATAEREQRRMQAHADLDNGLHPDWAVTYAVAEVRSL